MCIIPPNPPKKSSLSNKLLSKSDTTKTPLAPASSGDFSYAQKMLQRSQQVVNESASNEGLGIIGKCSRQILLHSLRVPTDRGSKEFKKELAEFQESRRLRFEIQHTLINLFKGRETPKGSSFGFHTCKIASTNGSKSKTDGNGSKSKTDGEIRKDGEVDIIYSHATGKSKYEGLQSCKKLACPHCAEIKALKDKQILEAIKACHAKAGGGVLMVTLTNSHHKGMKLEELISGQQIAINKFNKALSKMHFWQEFGGKLGAVRAWEILYGSNGWHPHFHLLIYLAEDITERDEKGRALEEQPRIQVIENSLSEEWIKSCVNSGLPAPSVEHGVSVQDGTHAEKYIGKYGDEIINMKGGWGSSAEMTRSNLKNDDKSPRSLSDLKSGDKGFTPWQLLKMAHAGCERSGQLYVEYVYATYGTAPLYFYPGTKSLYDYKAEIKLMEEEQRALIAQQFEDNIIPDDRVFIRLDNIMWKAVVFCRKRAELLTATETDAHNEDFEHKTNTMQLINNCLNDFLEELQKSKINEVIADTQNDEQLRNSTEDEDIVTVEFLSTIEKKVQSRVGSKSLNDGLEILHAVCNINLKSDTLKNPILEPVPDWMTEIPPSDYDDYMSQIPADYEQCYS